MAKHTVTFTIPERKLGKADITFNIKRDNFKIGRLNVSNGCIVWVPKDRSKGYGMSWVDFDLLMKEKGKR